MASVSTFVETLTPTRVALGALGVIVLGWVLQVSLL